MFLMLKVLRVRKSACDWFGVNFWSRDFFRSLILVPIRSSPSLEIPSTPQVLGDNLKNAGNEKSMLKITIWPSFSFLALKSKVI